MQKRILLLILGKFNTQDFNFFLLKNVVLDGDTDSEFGQYFLTYCLDNIQNMFIAQTTILVEQKDCCSAA